MANHTTDGGTYQEVIIGRRSVTFTTGFPGASAKKLCARLGSCALSYLS
jgi:hypothetical protein